MEEDVNIADLSTREKLEKTFEIVKESSRVSTGREECPNNFGNLRIQIEKGFVAESFSEKSEEGFLEDLLEIGVAPMQIHDDGFFYVKPIILQEKTVEKTVQTTGYGDKKP